MLPGVKNCIIPLLGPGFDISVKISNVFLTFTPLAVSVLIAAWLTFARLVALFNLKSPSPGADIPVAPEYSEKNPK